MYVFCVIFFGIVDFVIVLGCVFWVVVMLLNKVGLGGWFLIFLEGWGGSFFFFGFGIVLMDRGCLVIILIWLLFGVILLLIVVEGWDFEVEKVCDWGLVWVLVLLLFILDFVGGRMLIVGFVICGKEIFLLGWGSLIFDF